MAISTLAQLEAAIKKYADRLAKGGTAAEVKHNLAALNRNVELLVGRIARVEATITTAVKTGVIATAAKPGTGAYIDAAFAAYLADPAARPSGQSSAEIVAIATRLGPDVLKGLSAHFFLGDPNHPVEGADYSALEGYSREGDEVTLWSEGKVVATTTAGADFDPSVWAAENGVNVND
jgi:hypothetical protein